MAYQEWSITIGGTRHSFDPVEVVSWSVAGREYIVDDTPAPRQDGRWFGQDFAIPGDVEIELIIRAPKGNRQERFEAVSAMRTAFTEVWNADAVRNTAGAVAELEIAGEVVVEGRPRHVDWDDSRVTYGIIRGTAVFVRDIDQVFSSSSGWQSAVLGLIPAQSGGLKAPLKAPLRTTSESTRAAPLIVGGNAPAWPVLELKGPIQSNAQLLVHNRWRIFINRALGPFDTVRIDTRPGKRATYLNGQPRQILDPRSSMLGDCSLLPGTNVLSLRGSSIEGTAQVTVQWRDTRGAI